MSVRSSLAYLRPYRKRLTTGVVMLALTNVFGVGVPLLFGRAIDEIQASGTDQHRVHKLVLIAIALAVGTAVSRILSRIWIFNAARGAEYDLRSDLFGHMLNMSPGYYRDHPVGDVMSRLTNDVQTVRAMWGFGLVSLANSLLAFVSVLGVMLWTDPRVTLFAIVPFPLIYFTGKAMSKRMWTSQRNVQVELGKLSSRIQEDLGAMQVIKTYGLEKVRRKGFIERSEKLLDENMAAARVRIQLGPALNTLAALSMVLLILMGGRAVIHNDMTQGDILAFAAYLMRLVWPTLTLGFMLALVQRGRVSWARLAELTDVKTDVPDGTGEPLPASKAPAKVEVKDLTITIGDRAILEHIDLELKPGTITAIVGRTGAGKSTLVDALCRLIPVPPGSVFIDGRDTTTLPLASLRQQIGYAPQEAFLFSTTIADNIAMGYGGGTAIPAARAKELESVGRLAPPDLRDEPRVVAAATAAGLVRDLAAMPEGLATIVGERGITLSGGQRQRVALARALAAEPRLLVLDDSLSSVDAETEKLILSHLRAVMHGRTAVIISHRVAAIKDADQIIVIDQGKVIARGRHEQLLADGGTYADLYKTQLDTDVVKEAS
ncbi:MAG TPA: ABC transporter ATP-binding protein [Kofleriaceae bacterium]